MDHAAICALVLKMDEPGLARPGFHPTTLMWSIYLRPALRQYLPRFVWTVNILRAQRQLPTRLDATRRRKYVVVAIMLVKFRTLDRWVRVMPVENHYAVIEQLRAVGTHPADYQ